MSDLPVLYESDGRLARITLNRPEVLNASDDALPAALESAVKRATSDQGVKAIILAGTGRSPEGINFKKRAEEFGWKQAEQDRDQGSFDWTKNIPFTKKKLES